MGTQEAFKTLAVEWAPPRKRPLMLPISAADAISPAVQRTRAFLFRPFRLGTYLKFCLVAFLAEGFGGNFSSSGSGRHVANHGGSINTPFTVSPGLIAAGVAM